MVIQQINKQYVLEAIHYIDENGVPDRNTSTGYVLVTEDGRKYPPKYVIAVARNIATGDNISTEDFNTIQANSVLEKLGFTIDTKREKYVMNITADEVVSTDERFTIDNISAGDNYKPLEIYFKRGDVRISRNYKKSEKRNTNQTLPRLACQIYEKQIAALSNWDKEQFPICQYNPNSEIICGIFSTIDEFKKHRNTIEYLVYSRDDGPQFVMYCWNIFSTIMFVQECLKRFGEPEDKFVLVYREKDKKENKQVYEDITSNEELVQTLNGYRNPYSSMLVHSKNIIFRGAPGTGKSYLAKEIATDIISDGYEDDYEMLSDEQKKQVEFVQFHPSYDYSDFVEGLRPKMNDDGSMGFELQDGIFKKFVERARENYEKSQKSKEILEQEISAQESISKFFDEINLGSDMFKTLRGSEFYITDVDEKHIYISIPENETVNKLTLSMDEVKKLVESGEDFQKISDITHFFGKQFASQGYSYDFAIYKAILEKKAVQKKVVKAEKLKKYIFIIDEINRGEISKIFGELFFAIDPGYRGKSGEVSTQYANMHSNPTEKFYIPENVYIIGTMNDIDRSVDSFDFAMRRRFRFVEIKADDRLDMLDILENEELKEEAIRRMSALNKEIVKVDDLNENYQVGAAYFLKLKSLSFDELWTDSLKPLLQDYVRGMYDEEGIMDRFSRAYGYMEPVEGESDEAVQD